MKSTKECPSCGAQNDPILTNCIFCKAGLPQIDMNSISNEDLVLNAGEWVGKARQHDYSISNNDKDTNVWTGKGVHSILVKNSDVVGSAEKYLSLLQVRSISNANLLPINESLRKQLDENKRFAVENDPMNKLQKERQTFMKYLGIVFLIIIVLGLIGIMVISK